MSFWVAVAQNAGAAQPLRASWVGDLRGGYDVSHSSVAGSRAGGVELIVPLSDVLGLGQAGDVAALEMQQLFARSRGSLPRKLQHAAAALDCPPTMVSVAAACAQQLLRHFDDDAGLGARREF